MKEISEYYYDDDSDRVAVIVKEETGYLRNKGFHVEIRDKDNVVLSSVDVSEHSLRYAEDCAENYATGIISFDKTQ